MSRSCWVGTTSTWPGQPVPHPRRSDPPQRSRDMTESDDPLDAVRVAAQAAASKTDEETVVLDVGDVLSITGWFVITGGRNDRQVKAVVEEVESQVAAAC